MDIIDNFEFPSDIETNDVWRYGIDIDLFTLYDNLIILSCSEGFHGYSMNETFNQNDSGWVNIVELYYKDDLIADQSITTSGDLIATAVDRSMLPYICYLQQYLKSHIEYDEIIRE